MISLRSSEADTRLLWAAALVPLAVVAGLILWLRPWYGLIDDGALLAKCDTIAARGYLAAFAAFLREDLTWGMFRPTYFAVNTALYCPTVGMPTLVYLVNAANVFATLFALGYALYGALPARRWSAGAFTAAFAILALCVYRWHELFLVASLQEKFVLAAGALALALATRAREGSALRHLSEIAALTAALALGFSTKAQFLLFLPGIGLLLLAREDNDRAWHRAKVAAFALASVGGVVAVKALANRGVYTAGYSFAKAPENLRTPQALTLLAIGFASFAFELRRAHAKGGSWRAYARALVPSSFLLSFLAIMSPWSIGDSYIIAPAAALAAFCILSAFQAVPLAKARVLLFVFAAFALALTTYRNYRGLGRWSDLRAAIFSETLREEAGTRPISIVMNCMEGHDVTRYYFDRFSGFHPKIVREIAQAENGAAIYAIADSAFCLLPPASEGAALEPVTQPLFNGSVGLYRLNRGEGYGR